MMFLMNTGYYRQFIERFSKIALPLTKLTQKGVKFEWSDDCEHNFQELKNRLVITPILTIPSGSGGFVMYSDVPHWISKKVSSAIYVEASLNKVYAF